VDPINEAKVGICIHRLYIGSNQTLVYHESRIIIAALYQKRQSQRSQQFTKTAKREGTAERMTNVSVMP
jgi:hypothetical protein